MSAALPEPSPPSQSAPLLAYGKAAFERAECSSCHAGNALTDGESYALGYGGSNDEFDTPSLRSVALSPPYLHDGSAKSLDDLVADQHDRMGKVSALSPAQRKALVAYLRTL